MKTVEELYEEMKGFPVEEQNRKIAEYGKHIQTLPEEEKNRFYESFMESLDKIEQDQKRLRKDVEQALLQKRVGWLNESWVNKSDICNRLYGKTDKATVSYFTQQRHGKRPWKPGQLERLDEIRKELMATLAQTS